jgi:hypothetical protein
LVVVTFSEMRLSDLHALLASKAAPDPERFAHSIAQSMRAEGIPVMDEAVLERYKALFRSPSDRK